MYNASHPASENANSNAAASSPTAGGDGSTGPAPATPAIPSEQKQRAVRVHTVNLVNQLIRSIDVMVYCQLSILYYMDCSMLKFLLRALPHWFYFTPKPDVIPPIPAGQRPYIGVIFGTNLLCMLLHAVFRPIAAGESTRFYLHGGLLIDFVGQVSPVSRWRLWASDLLCLALQVLMLGVNLEKQKLSDTVSTVGQHSDGMQDHDAEESGMLRQSPSGGEGIEMQRMRPGTGPPIESNETGRRESRDEADTEQNIIDLMGTFYSGERVIANLNVLDIVRKQWKSQGVAATANGVQTAASLAGRRFTVTFGGRSRTIGQG